MVVGARTLSLFGPECPRLVRALHAPRILHSRRLSVSRMRENFTYGLMRGRWRRAAGLLDRDTRPKGEKRSGVAGPHAIPRHCSTLQLRNVREHLPPHLQAQVTSAMRAAFRLAPQEGIAKLKQQASWLEREYPDAAGSLREGLEELFTINRRGLSPSRCRALGSTNIIENPNSSARRKTHRVTRWRDGEMVKRWAAAAFLEAERSFRRILGYRDLWMLKAILNENQVANDEKAA